MTRIFLSYAREDETQVRGIYRRLLDAGFEVWMDKINLLPGQRWQQEIPRAIRNSDFILIFFSKNSVTKQGYIQREFRLALDTLEEMPPDEIHTIPIRLDDCQIPEHFRHFQWSDISEEGEFDRIVQALRLGMEQRQTFTPKPALEPPLDPIPDRDCAFSESKGRSVAEAPVQPLQEPESITDSQPEKPLVSDQKSRWVSEVETKPQDTPPLSASKPVSGSTSKPPAWVLVVSVGSGLAFLILLLAIAVWISHPTSFQIFIFRVVLGLAAAAFGATIPGFLRIELPLWGKGLISATGALALFVLVYLVNPSALVDSDSKPPPKIVKQLLAGVILDTQGNPLPGVTVTLPAFSLSNTTDTRGIFSFEVQAEAAASVRLMAQKPGYQTHRQDATLGNTQLSFTMERRTVDVVRSPAPPVSAVESIEAGCSFSANHIDGDVGSSHVVSCPPGCDSGLILGTDVYAGDSSICQAAQHAGYIDSQGGLVGVVLDKGRPAYRGSHRNGIQSWDYGKSRSSFRLGPVAGEGKVQAVPVTPPVASEEVIIEAGCSFIAKQIDGDVGSSHVVSCPSGCDSGFIWGTDVYTGDSSICKAAQHAGYIDSQGGLVGVVLDKGRPAYRGSHRNGIQSSDYGKYDSSFRFTELN